MSNDPIETWAPERGPLADLSVRIQGLIDRVSSEIEAPPMVEVPPREAPRSWIGVLCEMCTSWVREMPRASDLYGHAGGPSEQAYMRLELKELRDEIAARRYGGVVEEVHDVAYHAAAIIHRYGGLDVPLVLGSPSLRKLHVRFIAFRAAFATVGLAFNPTMTRRGSNWRKEAKVQDAVYEALRVIYPDGFPADVDTVYVEPVCAWFQRYRDPRRIWLVHHGWGPSVRVRGCPETYISRQLRLAYARGCAPVTRVEEWCPGPAAGG